MQGCLRRWIGWVGFLALIGCPPAVPAPEAPPLEIVASLPPLADVARVLAGDAAHVTVLLAPGASPHGFRLRAQQAEHLSAADLLLTVGLGVDPWADRAADASGNHGLQRLTMAAVSAPPGEPEEHVHNGAAQEHVPAAEPHACGSLGGDPHIWLDPIHMLSFTEALSGMLGKLRPGQAPAIAGRAAAYRLQLSALDRECRERLERLPSRTFLSLHAAFGHFAARYGLEEVAVYQAHMQEPDPRTLEHVLQLIEERDLSVLFVQPQIRLQQVVWLQEQTGLALAVLDPLGQAEQSYLDVMQSNLAALEAALAPGREQ